jgi:hypothetical protein
VAAFVKAFYPPMFEAPDHLQYLVK